MELITNFRRQLSQLIQLNNPASLWVSLSGGLDSMALLKLLVESKDLLDAIPVNAVHVNHGLSPHADEWSRLCQSHCQQLGIPFTAIKVTPKQGSRLSLEAEARDARYQGIRDVLPHGAWLVTGHHLSDQSETFLIRLQRGSGPTGLSAMAVTSEVLPGLRVMRPLLNISRAELAIYAEQQGLVWVNDESNDDQSFDRNFIRHQVLPLLRQRWPSIDATIARSAQLCREQALLLEEYCADELAVAMTRCEPKQISVSYLQGLDPRRQAYLLRYWLANSGALMPSAAQLNNILQTMLGEREDKLAEVRWSNWVLRRYQRRLYLEDARPVIDLTQTRLIWELNSELPLPANLGRLMVKFVKADADEPRLAPPKEGEEVSVRFRQPQLHCQPYGRAGRRSLKKLLHEYQVPPWQRGTIPLIFYGDELVAAVGYWICKPYAVTQGEGLAISLNEQE